MATVKAATVVPAKAVERGQNGTYLYRIRSDDTVEVCPVTVQHVADGFAIIAEGLSPGDRIVVDGQYRLQPGARASLGCSEIGLDLPSPPLRESVISREYIMRIR